jgi:beta-N-acetylhexosaminidase
LVASFRDITGRADAPVLIDQEGGRVQRMGPPQWPKYPPAALFGAVCKSRPDDGIALAGLAARLMAEDLAEVGINVDCLPVLDVPAPGGHQVIGDRAYASDPQQVAAYGRAVAEAMIAGGVLPVIKHIPGHGRALADSHLELPRVSASRAELEAADFVPFALLRDLPLAMSAHVVYEAIDPDRPGTTSSTVIGQVIRGKIGFDGLLMTDDLSMKALSGSFAERTAAAFAAGVDMALHCNGDLDEAAEVATVTPYLVGRAAERATAALARLKVPRKEFDLVDARNRLELALAGEG